MTVESVTYISDLNATYPAGTDAKSEGDDHIRNIKTAIKNTFPNINAAVTLTDEQLNGTDANGVALKGANNTFTGGNTFSNASGVELVGVKRTAGEFFAKSGGQLLLQSDQKINCTNLAGTAQIALQALAGSQANHVITLVQTLCNETADDGYIKFPIWNSASVLTFYLQWKKGTLETVLPGGNNSQLITWPTAFPNAILFAMTGQSDSSPNQLTTNLIAKATANCTVNIANPHASVTYNTYPLVWAVGY